MFGPLQCEAPSLIAAQWETGASLLTLTFSAPLAAGSSAAPLALRMDGVGSNFKSNTAAAVATASSSIVVPLVNQLGGTTGSPRISTGGPGNPPGWTFQGGIQVGGFVDFPVSVVP